MAVITVTVINKMKKMLIILPKKGIHLGAFQSIVFIFHDGGLAVIGLFSVFSMASTVCHNKKGGTAVVDPAPWIKDATLVAHGTPAVPKRGNKGHGYL